MEATRSARLPSASTGRRCDTPTNPTVRWHAWDPANERPPAAAFDGVDGVFIGIEDGVDGMVHKSDLSWTAKVNNPADLHHKGDDVEAISRTFSDGGGYNVKWGGSGTPEEIRHEGERVLAKGDGTWVCPETGAEYTETEGRLATEHALVDDNGAWRSSRFPRTLGTRPLRA